MIEPGTTVRASIWLDIEQAIPSAQFPEQYAHYLALLEERSDARFAVTGDTDPIGDEEYGAEWDALNEFADTMRINPSCHLSRAREALKGPRSARSYGVAWPREGSRQNS